MLKTLGSIAALSAAHLAQAEEVLDQEAHANTLPDSGAPEAPLLVRSNVKAKKHHPRFRPEIEDDRHLQHSVMRDTRKGRALADSEVCSRAINRMKYEQADFNQLLQEGSQDSNFEFTDETFAFPESIHWEDLPALQWNLDWDVQNLSWKRIKDVFTESYFSLWGKGDINPEDAIQGQLGNCWLIVAAMSIAEDPQRIKDIFQVEQKNSVGVYAAKMWLLGMPTSVVIDDYLPLQKWGDGKSTQYAQVAEDGALWGTLFEKAFAKYLGMYEAIDAGGGAHGIEAMTGTPFESFWHSDVEQDQSVYDELWKRMINSNETGEMVSSGSYTGTGNDQDTNDVGLPYNHAFSIMRALEVTTEQDERERLVEIRNPWGSETYWGDWSDSSDRWTDFMRYQVDHLTDDDGKFYMSFDDYVRNMEYTDFNLDVTGWHHASFAVFGDDEPFNQQEPFGDGSVYNVHDLFVVSEIDQDVSLSAHSYHFKHYHGECSEGFYNSEVMVKREEDEYFWIFNPGSIHGGISKLKAGIPYSVSVFSHFGEEDLVPHDWSIVAWAKEKPVKIFHETGRKSDTLRLLKDADSIEVPQTFDLSYDELIRLGKLHELIELGKASKEEEAEYDSLSARFGAYMERNGHSGRDPIEVWHELVDEFENSIEPVDPSSSLSKDELQELIQLHELINGSSPWDVSDQDWERYGTLYYNLSDWLYYEAGIQDQDPIDYAYEVIGVPNPFGAEPTKEELLILEQFYFKNWKDLPEDLKADVNRIMQKVYDYLYREQLWEVSPIQYVVETLGKDQAEVTLSDEALEHFLELYHKSWEEFTDQDYLDEMLLWQKLDAYMMQNDLYDSDPLSVVNELLGNEPKPVDPTNNEYPVDLLERLVQLDTKLQTDPWGVSDEEYNEYMYILEDVYQYLYYELGNTDADPIAYAYEVLGDVPTPVDPSSGLSKDELQELITLNELINGPDGFLADDKDWERFYTLYYNLSDWLYYEAGIQDQDPVDYAYEAIGVPNPFGAEPTKEELLILEQFYFKNWKDLPEDLKADVNRIMNKVYDYLYREQLWDVTPIQYVVETLGKDQAEVTLSDEALEHFLELYHKSWEEFTDQDYLDEMLLWQKLDAYMMQNDLYDSDPLSVVNELLGNEPKPVDPTNNEYPVDLLARLVQLDTKLQTDPWGMSQEEYDEYMDLQEDVYWYLYELGNFDADPIAYAYEVLGSEPTPVDPSSGLSKDELYELITLHEIFNGPEGESNDDDFDRYLTLYWKLEEWLYYEAGIQDQDPIDYAYEAIGVPNPFGAEPTKEELLILEQFYFKNWKDLAEDLKADVNRIMSKVQDYLWHNDIWDMRPIQYVVETLGKDQAEFTLSDEALEHFLELYYKSYEEFTDQDLIDEALLWLKLGAYMYQNDLIGSYPPSVVNELLGNETVDPTNNEYPVDQLERLVQLDAKFQFYPWDLYAEGSSEEEYNEYMDLQEDVYWYLYELGNFDADPIAYAYEVLGSEPTPVDPSSGLSKDELYELITLHEIFNGPEGESNDDDFDRYLTLYWKLEEWLYYEAGIQDQDPIDYAYEAIGVPNPFGAEPTKEELLILEELFYTNWNELREDMKAEYNRLFNKVLNYMETNQIYDIEPLQLVAELLGKDKAVYVTISPEGASRLLELYDMPWSDLSDHERTEDSLLWIKLNAYMSQNNLWDTDPLQVARELAGQAPFGEIEATQEQLEALADFFFSDGWLDLDDQDRQELSQVAVQIEESMWANGDYEANVAKAIAKQLEIDQIPKVEWTVEGLSRLVDLYPKSGDEMSEQDWADWPLLWYKWYAYVVQENMLEGDPFTDMNVLLEEFGPIIDPTEPIPVETFKLVDLTGDYGLHMDVQVVYSKPEKSLRMSAYSDPDTGMWKFGLQSGADRVIFAHAGEGEARSMWTFSDDKSASFNTACPYETVECSGKETFPKWDIDYEWMPEQQIMLVKAKDAYSRVAVIHLNTEYYTIELEVYGEDGAQIAYKFFQVETPSMYERVQHSNKYTEKADGVQYTVKESLDYYRGQQGNHTVSIKEEDEIIFDATFVFLTPYFNTTNVIIDFAKGKTAHIGCSASDSTHHTPEESPEEWEEIVNMLSDSTTDEASWEEAVWDEAIWEEPSEDIMPDDQCHEVKTFGGWKFELNRSNDWIFLSWSNADLEAQFTTYIWTKEERSERVDYWPNGVIVNEWDLSEAPIKASSADLSYFDETDTAVYVAFDIVSPSEDVLYLNDNIQMYDETNLHQFVELSDFSSFDLVLTQIIRQNETDRDMVMMLSPDSGSNLQFTKEKKLNLAPGFTREEYSFSPDGELKVDFSVNKEQEGRFSQNITFGETGVCILQVVDFNNNTWNRELLTDNCSVSQSFLEWQFPQGYGPLSEDPAFAEEEEPIDIEEIFAEGFVAGLDQAQTEDVSKDSVDPELMREYDNAMPAWIEEQDMKSTIFTCDSDVRIDHPFIEDDRMWALWASQDCASYDLKLTVILTQETEENNVGFYGAELVNDRCVETIYFEGAIACEFTVKSDSKFGMLFQGGFSPVYYTTEWISNV